MTTMVDNAAVARRALEVACSGKEPGAIEEVYATTFVDHVNSMTYRGIDGAHRSVALYAELFPDLRFVVEEQVTEGERVASRWTLHGTHRRRPVRLWGIVISRVEDGQIVEDWAASDSLDLIRQLGVWRSLLLLAKHWRLIRG
jgi:predicted ester cyclase